MKYIHCENFKVLNNLTCLRCFLNSMLKLHSALFVHLQRRIMLNPSHYKEKTNKDDSHLCIVSLSPCWQLNAHCILYSRLNTLTMTLILWHLEVLLFSFSSFLPDSLVSPQYHCQHIKSVFLWSFRFYLSHLGIDLTSSSETSWYIVLIIIVGFSWVNASGLICTLSWALQPPHSSQTLSWSTNTKYCDVASIEYCRH